MISDGAFLLALFGLFSTLILLPLIVQLIIEYGPTLPRKSYSGP
jgi:hypothetical protein